MTKSERFYSFFSSFGIPAYEENSVPADADGIKNGEPYLTYEFTEDTFDGDDININAQLFDKDSSWLFLDSLTSSISDYIGRQGKVLPVDNGYILVMRGTPFAQNRKESADGTVKCKVLTFIVRFYTSN